MNEFDNWLSRIKRQKEIRDNGGFNAVPLPFPKFSEFMPGLMRGTGYCLTANSSIGKSRWLKYAVPFNIFNFRKEHPGAFNFKVFYFTLEESKHAFINSMVATQLYRDHGIEIDGRDLESLRSHKPAVDARTLRLVAEYKPLIDSFFSDIEMYDGNVRPSSIDNLLSRYANNNGQFVYREFTDKEGKRRRKATGYVPNDPDEFVIVIIDPINLISQDAGQTKKQAIDAITASLMIHYRDICNYTFFIVQQQGADSEEQQFTGSRGELVIPKLLPTLQNLGDSRTTARDYDIVIGLFSPDRYGITDYAGYNLAAQTDSRFRMGKFYRQMILLKDRNGVADIKSNLYFNGGSNVWAELPPVANEDLYRNLNKDYNKFK